MKRTMTVMKMSMTVMKSDEDATQDTKEKQFFILKKFFGVKRCKAFGMEINLIKY